MTTIQKFKRGKRAFFQKKNTQNVKLSKHTHLKIYINIYQLCISSSECQIILIIRRTLNFPRIYYSAFRSYNEISQR